MAISTQSPHGSSSPNPNKRQKPSQDASCATEISDLPNHILLHILSFLPIKDVVASGILSKRWKPFWKSVPGLIFEDRDFPKVVEEGSGKATFVDVVNRVLLEHNASIQKFRIGFMNSYLWNVVPWIQKAIAHNVEELDLNLHIPGLFILSRFLVPGTIFSCKTLVVFRLWGAKSITLSVPKTASMPNLKMLELDLVSYADYESPTNLISCCSALEHLSLCRTGFDKLRIHSQTLKCLHCVLNKQSSRDVAVLDINAPLLQDLTIKDPTLLSIQVTNTGSLNKVTLELLKDFSWQSVIKCFRALIHNVKFLSLAGATPTALNLESELLPQEKYLNLTHLTLGGKCVWRPMLHYFLQCFEKLEVLQIVKDEVSAINSICPEIPWKDPAVGPSCLKSCLRALWIEDFRESEFELGMLRYILKNGDVLQKVEIHPADPYYQQPKHDTREGEKARKWEDGLMVSESNYRKLQVKFSIARKLMNFQKGSQTCEIDFF